MMIKHRYGIWMRETGKGPARGVFEPNDDDTKMTLRVENYYVEWSREQVKEIIRYLREWVDE